MPAWKAAKCGAWCIQLQLAISPALPANVQRMCRAMQMKAVTVYFFRHSKRMRTRALIGGALGGGNSGQ